VEIISKESTEDFKVSEIKLMLQTPSRTVSRITGLWLFHIMQILRSDKGWELITVVTPEGKSSCAL